MLRATIEKFRQHIINTKVAENFGFMTLQSVGNIIIGLVMLSYTLRTLGAENYGLYVFVFSIITYCTALIEFGFYVPTTKAVADNNNDLDALGRIVSRVILARIFLTIFAAVALSIVIFLIPMLREHWQLFAILFLVPTSCIFAINWYYQGLKRMRVITFITLAVRLLSIPLILIFVRDESCIIAYTVIAASTRALPNITMVVFAVLHDKLRLRLVSLRETWQYTKECLPFFFKNGLDAIKDAVLPVTIGTFLGMRDVAIFNLADKIVTIAWTLVENVNIALYPEFVSKATRSVVRTIIKYESIIGLAAMAGIAAFGYWTVWILGGEEMLGSYPIAIVLSMRIMSYLYVSACNDFIFIPRRRYVNVTIRQAFATVIAIAACYIGLSISPTIIAAVGTTAVAYILEILFCWYLARHTPYVEYQKST